MAWLFAPRLLPGREGWEGSEGWRYSARLMPPKVPNFSQSVDDLFKHLAADLGHRVTDTKDWLFTLRSDDKAVLEGIAESLAGEFHVRIEPVVGPDGDADDGGEHLLGIVVRDALPPKAVKSLGKRFVALALEHKVIFDGISCHEPADDEDLFDWVPIPVAAAQVQTLADRGSAPDAVVMYQFCVLARSEKAAETFASSLVKRGYTDVELIEDESGQPGLVVTVSGTASQTEFLAASTTLQQLMNPKSVLMVGAQLLLPDDQQDHA